MKRFQFLCITFLSLLTGMVYPMERSVQVAPDLSINFDPSMEFYGNSGEDISVVADTSMLLYVNFDKNIDAVKIVVDSARPTQQSLAQITFAKKVQQIAFDLMHPNEHKVRMAGLVGCYYDLDEEKNKDTRTALVGELDEDFANIKSYSFIVHAFIVPCEDQTFENHLESALTVKLREGSNKNVLHDRVSRVAHKLKQSLGLGTIAIRLIN